MANLLWCMLTGLALTVAIVELAAGAWEMTHSILPAGRILIVSLALGTALWAGRHGLG